MTENWKDIPGFEEMYQVSDIGSVKNIATGSILKNSVLKTGYLKVTLRKNGAVFQKLVHRLVAEAFIPNPKNKPEVNHKFGDKSDNRVTELEWNTTSENLKHSFRMGHHRARIGKENELSRRVVQLHKNGGVVKIWDSIMDVERTLKIDNANISKVAVGNSNRKTAGGYAWKFI